MRSRVVSLPPACWRSEVVLPLPRGPLAALRQARRAAGRPFGVLYLLDVRHAEKGLQTACIRYSPGARFFARHPEVVKPARQRPPSSARKGA